MKTILGALIISACLLTGCASTPPVPVVYPPNPLAPASRASLRLDTVQVEWASSPSAGDISGVPDDEKDDLKQAIETSVKKAFSKSPTGSEAVTFKVVVRLYSGIANGRISYEGVATSFFADVHVIRNSDQTELAVYKGVYGEFSGVNTFMGIAAARRMKPTIHKQIANAFAQSLHLIFERN